MRALQGLVLTPVSISPPTSPAQQCTGCCLVCRVHRQAAAHLQGCLLHSVLLAGALLRHQLRGPAQDVAAAALPKAQHVAHPAPRGGRGSDGEGRGHGAGRSCEQQAGMGTGMDGTAAQAGTRTAPCGTEMPRGAQQQPLSCPRLPCTHLRGTCCPAGMRLRLRNVPWVLPGSRTKAAPSCPRNCSTACSLRHSGQAADRGSGQDAWMLAAAAAQARLCPTPASCHQLLASVSRPADAVHTPPTCCLRGGPAQRRWWAPCQRSSGPSRPPAAGYPGSRRLS